MTFSGAFDCASLIVGQLFFRRGEDDGDRLDLRDRHDAGLRRGIDDVADIDLAQADDARDRRLDLGVVELGLGVENGRIVGGDLRGQLRHRGTLGVGLLPGREFAELGVALQIEIGVGEVGLVLRLLGLGLIERRLVGARIDFGEQVALIDQLAFLERDLVDLAVDAGPHLHGIEALNGAEPGQVDRKIGLLDRRDGDGNGSGRGISARSSPRTLGTGDEIAPSRNNRPRRALRSARSNGWSGKWSYALMVLKT